MMEDALVILFMVTAHEIAFWMLYDDCKMLLTKPCKFSVIIVHFAGRFVLCLMPAWLLTGVFVHAAFDFAVMFFADPR